jgi:small conductance mechanosensitive channel
MDEQLAALDQTRSALLDLAILYGPRVLAAVLIIAVGFVVGRWVGRALDRLLRRLDLDVTVRTLVVRVAHLLVLLLFAIMALQNLGVELLPLIAGLGIAGAGIALALQGVLGNLAAGLTIIFTRPFRVGEYISIAGEEGLVESISLFSTILGHPDRSRVVIPNRKIVGEILHNYGTIRQLALTVGVAYDTDVGAALAVIEDVLSRNPRVLREPAPLVRVSALADSSVGIAVGPWVPVTDYGAAAGELNREILEALRAKDIVIPFPQREVRLLGERS